VWNLLAKTREIDLTLFFGSGSGKGSISGTGKGIEFTSVPLHSIHLTKNEKLRVIHPLLVPKVITGKFDIVVSEGLTYFPNSLMLAFACKLLDIPFILYEAPPVGPDTRMRKLFSPLYRKLCSHIITYTNWGKQYYIGKGFDTKRISVALNTIDTESVISRLNNAKKNKFDLVEQFKIQESFVVGYLGSLEKRKQPQTLLNSIVLLLKDSLNVKLFYIGDGHYRDTLENMIPEKYKDSIIVLGRQDSPEQFLQLCSVLVLPAQGGLAVPHALTCGVPCIATEDAEGPGIRDYIKHGENGIILDTPIKNYLTETLRKLYNSPEMLSRIKSNAQESSTNFTVLKMVNQITDTITVCFNNSMKN